MSAEQHETEICRVSDSRAGAELERLLGDARFHPTDRQRSIINYLAERRFAGCDEPVKAYSIAIDLLGKTSSFDPTQDPIVRIEMSRLRSLLEDHYEAFGHQTDTWVEIPRGRYVAQFTSHEIPAGAPESGIKTDESPTNSLATNKEDTGTAFLNRRWTIAASSFAGLCLAAGLAGVTWFDDAPAVVGVPTVTIDFQTVDPLLKGDASQARDMLLTALAPFRTIAIVVGPSRARVQPDYHLEIKYFGSDNDRAGRWQIVDARSGHLLDAGVENVAADGRTPAVVRSEVASALAARIGSWKGPISLNETRRAPRAALGNVCVLRAEWAIDSMDSATISSSTNCLKQTVALQPGNASALAALSSVVLVASGGEAAEEAAKLAERAMAADPLSERAHMALARSQFAGGRIDAAIESGNRALALNRNNPDVSATLATLLFSGGYWKAAVDMADDASRYDGLAPREALLVKALDAYRRREWSNAILIVEQGSPADLTGNIVRIAALGQIDAQDARLRFAELQQQFPGIENSFRSMIASARYKLEVVASLEDGLRKAGAQLKVQSMASAN